MLRSFVKVLAPAAAVIGALSTVSPASAATFASFDAVSGAAVNFTATNSGSGTQFTEVSEPVSFNFLASLFGPAGTGISAVYTVSAATTTPAINVGFAAIQTGIAGSIAFKSVSAITLLGHTYAAGSDLLTATFTNANVFGIFNSQTGSLLDDTVYGAVSYTSAFLTFKQPSTDNFALSLTSVTPAFSLGANGTLSGFTATAAGSFSATPTPAVNGAVPEPATWLLMLVGFGAIGLGVRGSTRRDLLTA